jgi:hypothetical protein
MGRVIMGAPQQLLYTCVGGINRIMVETRELSNPCNDRPPTSNATMTCRQAMQRNACESLPSVVSAHKAEELMKSNTLNMFSQLCRVPSGCNIRSEGDVMLKERQTARTITHRPLIFSLKTFA